MKRALVLALAAAALVVPTGATSQEPLPLSIDWCLTVRVPGEAGPMSTGDKARLAKALRQGVAIIEYAESCDSSAALDSRAVDSTLPVERWELSGLSWRWLQPDEATCNSGPRCWGLLIESLEGCASGAVAEIDVLDGDGAVIDTRSWNSGPLAPSEPGLIFATSLRDDAELLRPVNITCG